MALVARLNVNRQINQSDLNPVGMVVYADLTEVQFQALNGTGWVLADGRNVAGSTYATVTGNATVSDLRGVLVRSKNNGRSDGNQDPDGERALRSFQNDALQNITGGFQAAYYNSNVSGAFQANGTSINQQDAGITARPSMTFDASRVARTSSETRPRNVALNAFIKIN
jgi:hypothetical protein